ncbi:MAG: hypothetical protein AAGI23_20140 [Bacteroidota bacterium]
MKFNTTLRFAFLLCLCSFSSLLFSCEKEEMVTDPPPEEEEEVFEEEEKELQLTTIISNFPANGAVSVDDEGNVYVSEYGTLIGRSGNGRRIFKLSPTGEILETLTDMSGPMGTKKDSKGNLYVNNDNNMIRGQVTQITPEGEREIFAPILGWPSSITIDPQDNLYITNYTKPTIHKITPDGTAAVFVEDDRLAGCVGIDLDSECNLIVSNFVTADIYKIDQEKNITLIANIPDIVVQNFGIGYLAVVDDVIYATGIAVSKIFKVSMDGEVEVFAGTGEAGQTDGKVLEATLSNPNGIGADKQNKILYISEWTGVGGVRKIEL